MLSTTLPYSITILHSVSLYILHYTILYYTILYYTILYYTILYYQVYYTMLYYTILYYAMLYYTILYYTILYYTILCYTILYWYYLTLAKPCWVPSGWTVSSSCNTMVMVERTTNKMGLAALPTALSRMRDGGNSRQSNRLRSSTARSFVVINRG